MSGAHRGARDRQQWYRTLGAELRAGGIAEPEAQRTIDSTRAEAEASGLTPSELYGPAVPYAREVASALRETAVPRIPAANHPGPVVLRLTGVSVHRGRRTVLDNLDLTVRRGEVVAVVGANGAGKSTLLQVCAGLLRASAGRVERSSAVGYAPQLDGLAPLLTVDEHLHLVGAARGVGRARAVSTGHRILSRLGWTPRGAQPAGSLSGGTQQKLNLALAQLDSPDLLLLDEPYQGLDALAYEDLWTLIASWRESGAGVLLVTHLLRDIGLVDRVVELPSPEETRPGAAA